MGYKSSSKSGRASIGEYFLQHRIQIYFNSLILSLKKSLKILNYLPLSEIIVRVCCSTTSWGSSSLQGSYNQVRCAGHKSWVYQGRPRDTWARPDRLQTIVDSRDGRVKAWRSSRSSWGSRPVRLDPVLLYRSEPSRFNHVHIQSRFIRPNWSRFKDLAVRSD